MSFAARQQQFKSAIRQGLPDDVRIAENFGFSNSARVIEGGLFAATVNMETASQLAAAGTPAHSGYVFLCVLTFPPHDEVYFAITVRDGGAALNHGLARLYELRKAELEGGANGRINNNVKFFLTDDGRIAFANDFTDSLDSSTLDAELSAPVDFVEFAIWPPAVSARRSLLAREFVGYLGRLVGRDRVHERAVWTAETAVGPLMRRMPDSLEPTELRKAIADMGGHYPAALVDRFHAGLNHLKHKHFVILSGLSGTGKTQLALQYARAVHGIASMDSADPLLFICPVRPEWTDPSGLTGYEDRLTDRYVTPPFLEAVLVATAHPTSPVFVVLDEMNLARVEYYFSDVLSAIESRHPLQLHSSGVPMEGSTGAEIPADLRIPDNLFLIGTINVDETTSTLSDKVLDRAVVIDMSEIDLPGFLAKLGADDTALAASIAVCAPLLQDLSERLQPHGLGFGYRLAEEFVRYHAFAVDRLGRKSEEVLDDLLLQKALARLRGTDAQRELLDGLAKRLEPMPRSGALIARLRRDL
ncbi:MAG: McrB family protein, partial [Brevundimonas sp.]